MKNAIIDTLLAVLRYLIHRATEPSTYKGLLTMVAAFSGWKATQQLDLASPVFLEALTWGGLFLAGLLNAILPQSLLYRDKAP